MPGVSPASAAPEPELSPPPPAPVSPPNEVDEGAKTVVSDAHLRAWWAFYRAVRPENQQTEDDAMAHFQRCFPRNSVTRVRIRALRGPQKSGPKGNAAE